jgi:3-methyladenine DNA glycosylase/8-oxoguanine DNA glycosylase
VLSTVYSPAERVNIGETLRPLRRGYSDPTFRVDASGLWRTLRTPAGAATMHLQQESSGIGVTAWGPGAEWAIAGVPELLGSADDWDGLDLSESPLLAEARRRHPGLRLLRTRQVFEMLLVAVLEQKVTGQQAKQSWRSLLTKYGETPPGPAPAGMRVFPEIAVWRRVPSWDWHRAGVGPQRADTIMRALAVADGLGRSIDDDPGAAEKKLRTVPGIGVWTAAETLQRSHGADDHPSIGDFNLPKLVGWTLAGHAVDDDGMLELLEPWRGQRQRVVRLIELVGTMPRFAPRITIQDHRGH